jgi:catechol 2,3-dioxygenase-like lactoylglutathione lyase family enzyme
MNIIDHLSVGVSDIAKAQEFYDATLSTLGSVRLASTEGFAAYGAGAVQFLVMLPENGAPASNGNGTHICFAAPTTEAVDAFHAAALKAGGVCEGEPGPRPGYPMPGVYTTFVRDPFGNKLEAIHGGFSGAS